MYLYDYDYHNTFRVESERKAFLPFSFLHWYGGSFANAFCREVCTLPNDDQRREQIYNRLIEADFNEKNAMELSYSLDAKLGKVLYTEQTSYWDKLTEMMMWVARQNIAKAWMIQTGDKPIPNLKECYEKINWIQILEEQNKVSSDQKDGIIWVLCTFITFVGEYKFFWNIA